jgi:hypothetical protein
VTFPERLKLWRSPRFPAALVSGGLAALFAVSRWLQPDPSGHGTHLQLGLLPCTFFVLTGLPCPLCGATTSFALMADGRPVDAFFNQPFATFLAASCALGLVLALTELIQPSGPATRALTWLSERDASAAAIFLVLMFSGWTYKIAVTLNFF